MITDNLTMQVDLFLQYAYITSAIIYNIIKIFKGVKEVIMPKRERKLSLSY